jgi:cytidylate kinase
MNTNGNFVITISRELGSGGRTVGRKLAEKLGVRYSDKELIQALIRKFNLTASGIEKLKGEKKNWLADVIQLVAPVPKVGMLIDADSRYVQEYRPDLTPDDIFKAESQILREIDEHGPCVIAGRSGFFVLEERPDKIDVFITATDEHRIARVMRKQEVSREEAERIIKKVDKARDNYVKRYTGRSRYDVRNYDLVINMDGLSEDDAVDVILSYIQADGK